MMITPSAQPSSPLSAVLSRLFMLLAVSAMFGSGCTSAVTQLQRGRALQRLQFEVNLGTSLPLSDKAIRSAIEAEESIKKQLRDAEDGAEKLTENDARKLTEVAAALLLFTPLPSNEMSLRGGIGWGVDVGLRLTGPRKQIDAKWQALDVKRHGIDLGLSLAYGWHSSPAASLWESATSAAESLKIMDYQRRDLTLSVIGSRDIGDVFSMWLGLAYSRSSIRIGSKLTGVATDLGIAASALTIDETMQQIGGQLGFRVGYKYVFFVVEFSVMQAYFSPSILGQKVNLSGLLYTPTFALQVAF